MSHVDEFLLYSAIRGVGWTVPTPDSGGVRNGWTVIRI